MAVDTSRGSAAMDYAEHMRTYHGFLKATQYGIAAMVVLLVGMYVFLVR